MSRCIGRFPLCRRLCRLCRFRAVSGGTGRNEKPRNAGCTYIPGLFGSPNGTNESGLDTSFIESVPVCCAGDGSLTRLRGASRRTSIGADARPWLRGPC